MCHNFHMKVQPLNNKGFRGYDARPLKGFLMNGNPYGIAREMKRIGEKEGFKLYSLFDGILCEEGLNVSGCSTYKIWAQDMWTIVKDKLIHCYNNFSNDALKEFFNLEDSPIQKNWIVNKTFDYHEHISGGNIFIVKIGDKEELLIGEDEYNKENMPSLLKMYSVDKIIKIPQMDFHLDLFIRPLDNKRILIADDEMSLSILKEGYSKFKKYVFSLPAEKQNIYLKRLKAFSSEIKNFKKNIKENKSAQADDVVNKLVESGYEAIRVPGRIYNTSLVDYEYYLSHICNYMNANVVKNNKGDLVYITNKSVIDELLGLTPELSKRIGFSFEESFIKSIEPYIKREHIYFIEGKDNFVKNVMLTINQGGIHCACAEVPEGVTINDKCSKG